MKTQSKVLLLTSGLLLASLNSSLAAPCPQITSEQLRQVCRWEPIEKTGIVDAGHVSIGSVTLHNDLKTCDEGDSIKEFFKGKEQYTGEATRHPLHNNKAACVYQISKGNKKNKFVFQADGVDIPTRPAGTAIVHPEPAKPQVASSPSKKMVEGWSYMDADKGVQVKQVEVKEKPARPAPAAPPEKPRTPPPPPPDRPPPPHTPGGGNVSTRPF
ncbi:MAG: hypothetical protein FJX71_06050, partial [Alphaproteobacteria bacterium]|nr:hypothetical protein [Alphaproteobacteria bacterium]